MKKLLIVLFSIMAFSASAQLPYNFVKISNSPTNGKYRAIEIVGFNIRFDLKTILIITRRHFYSQDPTVNFNSELTSTDYPIYEHNLTADNYILCNPSNGLTLTKVSLTDSTFQYQDPLNNVVTSPVGLFDFFQPLLTQNVALLTLIVQNVTTEDQVYHTWDK